MKKICPFLLLLLAVACKNKDKNENGNTIPPPDQPKNISYSIVNSYPHDTSSFTEGLLIYQGSLYESTGNYKNSKLLKIDINTGKPLMEAKLEDKYFGEGIAIIKDTIYQLTYHEHTVFVYTLKDFRKVREMHFDLDEGWGMTTDGTYLIASDGSCNIYYFEPSTFKLIKKIAVTDAGALVYNINELEYVDGYIYSNQWQLPYLLKIDPNDGKVIAKADLNDMWNRVKAKDPQADVPNGIAYDSATKKMYVTGKLWPSLFEIQFGQ
jgi:glutamine cyclotransferase